MSRNALMVLRRKPPQRCSLDTHKHSARWVTSRLCICSIFLSKYILSFYFSTHRLIYSIEGFFFLSFSSPPTFSHQPSSSHLLSSFQLFPLRLYFLPPFSVRDLSHMTSKLHYFTCRYSLSHVDIGYCAQTQLPRVWLTAVSVKQTNIWERKRERENGIRMHTN